MSDILLTIAIPAYNRPEWFKRALLSILNMPFANQKSIEIVVSDDSTIVDCKGIFNECIKNWNGTYQYHTNSPSLGMAGNWNQCIRLSSGQYILILHDDDYLQPNAGINIVRILKQYPQRSTFLFGVNVVNDKERVLKRQYFKKNQYLNPTEALKQVLTNSSFVRFPGIVIRKVIFDSVGYFDETVGETADIHQWVRIFYQSGLMCASPVIANYTVHSAALTMGMFNESVVDNIIGLFNWVGSQNWLSSQSVEECRVNYLHQFILAGTFRYLRRFKFQQAKKVFSLFKRCELYYSSTIVKWKILRTFFQIILD